MAVAAILKTVYSFREIVQQAKSTVVSEWNEHDLKNAICWADYCQKIYYQTLDKPYRSDLQQQICHLSETLSKSVACVEISLDSLRDAPELIKKAFIQNPHLPETLFSSLLNSESSLDSQILFSCARLKSDSHISRILLDKFTAATTKTSDSDPWLVTSNQAQAELLHQHLWHLVQENSVDFNAAVDNVIYCDKENGIAIIIECLRVKTTDDRSSICRDKLMKWIIEKSLDSENNFLWDLSDSLNIPLFHLHQQLTACRNVLQQKNCLKDRTQN